MPGVITVDLQYLQGSALFCEKQAGAVCSQRGSLRGILFSPDKKATPLSKWLWPGWHCHGAVREHGHGVL